MLSDLAPKLTGVATTDEARAEALIEAALALLPTVLRPGGRLLMKLFMSTRYDAILEGVARDFAEWKVTRPDATRKGSAELYLAAMGYRA